MVILIVGIILLTCSFIFNIKISQQLNSTLKEYLTTPPGGDLKKTQQYLNYLSKLESKLAFGVSSFILGLILTIIGLLSGL